MNFDVAIVGGGLVGGAAALALDAAGLRTVLIDPHEVPPPPPGDRWDSRVYAISPGSARFLQSLGVWERMDPERIQPVEAMHIRGDDELGRLEFSAYDCAVGELAFIVESGRLQQAMNEAAAAREGIAQLRPARGTALEWDLEQVAVVLEDGRRVSARLLVGADGANSWVREQAVIDAPARPYGQKGVVANFMTERPHGSAARQWFRRDGILALLPLPGNRVSMVWSTWDAEADRLAGLPPEALCETLAEATGGCLGALTLITPPAAFPLRLMRAVQMVAPRLALVGDAAHNVHPLAGQGVNLGFRDVRELARVLSDRGGWTDCGAVTLLRRFERARKEDIVTMQLTTDSLQRLFNNDNPILRAARNLGLRATDALGPLKSALVRHALA